MRNSLDMSGLCKLLKPFTHGAFGNPKDFRLLHSVLFGKVRRKHLKKTKEPPEWMALLVLLYKDYSLSLAFGNRIALTDDLVIIEATDTSALPTKSRTSRGPRYIYSLSQFVDNMRR